MKIGCAVALALLLLTAFALAQDQIPPHFTLGNNTLVPVPESLIASVPVTDQPVTGFAFNYRGLLTYCTRTSLSTITLPDTVQGGAPLSPPTLLAQNEASLNSYFEGPLLWDFDAVKLAGFRVGMKDSKPAIRELWIYDCMTRQLSIAVPQVRVNLACWSFDGRKLAYSVNQAADPGQIGLWLLDLNSRAKTKITSQPALSLAFYKNDAALFYQTPEPVTYSYQFSTAKAEKLPGFPRSPWQLSPDGRYRAALSEENLEVREMNTGNKVFSAPAAAIGGWLPYNNDIFAYLAPDQRPTITPLTGPEKSATLSFGLPAEVLPSASLQWSGQVQPISGEPGNIIWLAYQADNKLLAQRVWFGNIPELNKPPTAREGEREKAILLSNMKQIALAALMFADDHDETLPPSADFIKQLTPYVQNNLAFFQPGNPKRPVVRICYQGDGIPIGDIPDIAFTVIFKIDTGKDVVMGFADGHVKSLPRKEAAAVINDPNNALGPNGALKEKYAP
jgi:hypothetical protein